MQPPAPRMTLTVAAVARRLGVAPATLRTWDRRYGLGPSEHTAGAHRRYSATDLARLVVMRRLTLEGVAPAEAAAIAATTTVADGGFALASVSTIPASVIEAAVTDAEAIAGPVDAATGLLDPEPASTVDDPGTAGASPGPLGVLEARAAEDAGEGERESGQAFPAFDADWAVASLADRFADEIRNRGAARAWDAVLSPALGTQDAAMHAAVARALGSLPRTTGDRAVLVAGVDPSPRGPLVLAAAAALAEAGTGARSVGDGTPLRMLAAAVRRTRPPAVLLHAEAPRDLGDLEDLLRVRPAPLVVLSGPGWPAQVLGCVRAAGLADAVAACTAAVRA